MGLFDSEEKKKEKQQAMLKKYNIAFLPCNFVFGSKSYKNLIDIGTEKDLLEIINNNFV